MRTDRETIPVGHGRSIVRESVSLILDGYGTFHSVGPSLIYTNVFEWNAGGLCAFCLEQRVGGEGWDTCAGYENGADMSNDEDRSGFLVCTACKAIKRIGVLLELVPLLGDHTLTDTILMKYARGEKWTKISSVEYEFD
jgi:hypothetical protein